MWCNKGRSEWQNIWFQGQTVHAYTNIHIFLRVFTLNCMKSQAKYALVSGTGYISPENNSVCRFRDCCNGLSGTEDSPQNHCPDLNYNAHNDNI